uniref:Uncharacterized protein n=2 Tax=Rhodosorus marinus TaxID=101924 RepID=A0A7S2ZHB6_9RHOD|mmetsp:Transcript_19649/g.78204  ORF Transcript_19649/g.78204 Transcript_19649/m.78204 type:complete len:168 (+) Transcript_19649:226-729(+)|eukprot:CAMPEP_0113963170 /NCGR_PEP_ID=MMETSP0011_2-20120614/6351_1 /TAXON_ID=101924 /ORGANISM="Rhodosorus marinus" /LENGTH=167 /DNA_ID=CAMNT_0000975163 /DNA_START=157 /DNA_END=660 /DNA_ORIENTATION=+ /assembly_acc=CAM_ASM_000156
MDQVSDEKSPSRAPGDSEGTPFSKYGSSLPKDEARRMLVKKRLNMHGLHERKFFDSADDIMKNSAVGKSSHPQAQALQESGTDSLDSLKGSALGRHSSEVGHLESSPREELQRPSRSAGSGELQSKVASAIRQPPVEQHNPPVHDIDELRHAKEGASPLSGSIRTAR